MFHKSITSYWAEEKVKKEGARCFTMNNLNADVLDSSSHLSWTLQTKSPPQKLLVGPESDCLEAPPSQTD